MERAQRRDACMSEKFFFRQNVRDTKEANVVEMTINEIMNGNSEFKGLISYIEDYLKSQKNMVPEAKFKIDSYLNLFKLRASGVLKTPATWIRNFVQTHEKYEHDSIVNEEINYDLMWKICQMSKENVVFDLENRRIELENSS